MTGSPGGSRIITTVLQVIMNVIDHGMNIAEASEAPRIHHQWLPDELRIEEGISADTVRLLEGDGPHRQRAAGDGLDPLDHAPRGRRAVRRLRSAPAVIADGWDTQRHRITHLPLHRHSRAERAAFREAETRESSSAGSSGQACGRRPRRPEPFFDLALAGAFPAPCGPRLSPRRGRSDGSECRAGS